MRRIRRDAFEVRRDAAVELPGGRVRFDALFSRWGVQLYESGVEYRPESEVFSPESMASGQNSPGVLLHPEKNFGLDFGPGSYPVRGCTGDVVRRADDGIHTQGTLVVWDAEWLDLIMANEAAELSWGYTIRDDQTPGVAPENAPGVEEFGAEYMSVHREIIIDHTAGVPEGNAGTARVVLDAAERSRIAPVTRRALADIASARADARPYYFDLGSLARTWPRRQTQDNTTVNKAELLKSRLDALKSSGKLDEKSVKDAYIDIYGDSSDADMLAALAGLVAASAQPAAPAPAPAPAPAAPAAPVADAEEESGEVEEEEDAEAAEKQDAKLARAEDARADAMCVARQLFGWSYDGRADGKRLTTSEIQLACVRKLDAARADDIEQLERLDAAVVVRLDFMSAMRRIADESKAKPVEDLARAINQARGDRSTEQNAKLDELQKRLDEHTKAAAAANGQRKDAK